MKKFQQSSFQSHKPQAASQTKFVSSDKARNWTSADDLSDIFSEADEFTQFEAAPIQQQSNQGNDWLLLYGHCECLQYVYRHSVM